MILDNIPFGAYTLTHMVELMKFATESVTNYVSTLIMLIGIAGLVTGVANAILKQLSQLVVGVIIALKADVKTKVEVDAGNEE